MSSALHPGKHKTPDFSGVLTNTEGGTRTRTILRSRDFKSRASTIPPLPLANLGFCDGRRGSFSILAEEEPVHKALHQTGVGGFHGDSGFERRLAEVFPPENNEGDFPVFDQP